MNVLIRALKTQQRIDNLTRPVIHALDNQIGSVNIGGLYPYVSGGQFTSLGTFQPQISQQQIGTTLTITPRISPDGRVLMRVEPSIVAPQDTLIAPETDSSPRRLTSRRCRRPFRLWTERPSSSAG